MGTVFLAHEKWLDRDVAIKVLSPDRAESAVNRDRGRDGSHQDVSHGHEIAEAIALPPFRRIKA